MKIGYSFWGFLGDDKYRRKPLGTRGDKSLLVKVSAPDGNAFYSWSIINKLLEDGHEVFRIMPNRDKPGIDFFGKGLFSSFATNQRYAAATNMVEMYDSGIDWKNISREQLFEIWDKNKLYDCEVILHEWRMVVPNRNDYMFSADIQDYEPDYFIQNCLIRYCTERGVRLIIFDLDYKLDEGILNVLTQSAPNLVTVFELGDKWVSKQNAYHVEIPFDFRFINTFSPLAEKDKNEMLFWAREYSAQNNLVYVGNRYERDWCIDKYIPTELSGVVLYGNWLEGGRDSQEKWPNINFGPRIQTKEMPLAYGTSICTILLAKDEYLKHKFMTARIIESIFYGCIPLFIEEYGKDVIKKYAGEYSQDLTVSSKSDIIEISQYLKYNDEYRVSCIEYLRDRLKFMDVSNFVNTIYEVISKEK